MNRDFPFDTLGPIVGYRMWGVTRDALTSVTRETVWPALEPLRARCPKATVLDERPLPHARCTCGIYAMRSPGALASPEYLALAGDTDPRRTVLGEVRLWGRVFEHRHGWRAERAYPAGLFRTWADPLEPMMQRLLDAYGIEPLPAPASVAASLSAPGVAGLSGWTGSFPGWDDDPPGQLVRV
jgi:hypothetical protein